MKRHLLMFPVALLCVVGTWRRCSARYAEFVEACDAISRERPPSFVRKRTVFEDQLLTFLAMPKLRVVKGLKGKVTARELPVFVMSKMI